MKTFKFAVDLGAHRTPAEIEIPTEIQKNDVICGRQFYTERTLKKKGNGTNISSFEPLCLR